MKAVDLRHPSSRQSNIDDSFTFAATDVLRYLSASPTRIASSPLIVPQMFANSPSDSGRGSSWTNSSDDREAIASTSRKSSLESNDANESTIFEPEIFAIEEEELTLIEQVPQPPIWVKPDAMASPWTNDYC